ncbi:ovostatin-like isoform X2 [Pyxicephalus adspersus]|uniref:ovostatin-like isoform X2 n=1 Tax=Pyxicephalus adspersus TaxID=30357 RepID=UPI003B5B655C
MNWREMWLLCGLLLLGFLDGGRSEPQYVLSTPATLYSGETGKACVTLVNNKEKLDVGLVLQHEGQNTTIIAQDVSSPTYFQCGDYTVPKTTNAIPVALMLSVKGQETNFLDRKTVVIKPNVHNCIFQMDKPIYKPGQKVMCRVVCLNSQLKAVNQKFPAVYLRDPSGTRIKQWLHQETQRGVLSLEFQLIKDAPVGSYSFIAERESTYSLSQWFTVEEYVPPRFSVTVDVPNTISAVQDTLKFTVSAVYTYGEPVAGKVTVTHCKESGFYGRRQNCFKEKEDPCSDITGELDRNGTFKSSIDMSGRFMGLTGMSLRMDFIVTEEGTDLQAKESRYTWITTQPAKLNYDYEAMNQYYKRGIPYLVAAQLTDEQNNPMPNEDIDIELNQNVIQTVKTDSNGKIEYAIETSDMVAPNFTVRVSYKNSDQCYYADWRDTDYPTAEYTVFRFYSRTGSFLQANNINKELSCGQSHDIEVQYIMSQDGLSDGATVVPLYYLVLAKSKIVYHDQQDVDLTASRNGSITIALPVSPDMAPNANLVIYCILNGEVVVETVSLNIEKCFKNKVDMAFSEEKGLPGSTVEVLLSADPESICGLRVIDSSLLLLNSYERFSPEGIHGLFNFWPSYRVDNINVEEEEPPCLDPNTLIFYNGNYYLPTSSDSEGDSYGKLKNVGLIFGTGAQVRKIKVCDNNPPQKFIDGRPVPKAGIAHSKLADSVGFGSARGGAAIETVRTNFSDTFMWFMVPLDKDGHASLSEPVPDTITKWQGTAFCLSDNGGFGMTKYPANYTTFLPFFVELTKPYSFIRGETLILTAVVHNYLEQCVKVQVNLSPSDDFTAELKEGEQDACVCSKDRATYSWEVQANVLGEINFTVSAQTTFIGESCDGPNDASQPSRKDTVVQGILVQPEGIRQQLTLSNFVFVKPDMNLNLPVSIKPPADVVPDSISAYMSAVGDVFGLPVAYLHDLVQKPYGCAEQNVARMTPIIYVLEYLNATGQLTDKILEKSKQYLQEGYYRLLGYASGPAYKLFHSFSEPNTWLTATTFATLEKAKKYIQIDESRQQQTLIWMENQQRLDNGCFKAQGRPIDFMDTDADEEINLYYTAYFLISLLDTDYSLGKTLADGAMECLKTASTKPHNISTEVLMLYAFSKAGLKEYSDPLMAKLMQKAIVKDGTIHWQRENMPAIRPVPFFNPVYAPADTKLTAYMLLSIMAGIGNVRNAESGATKTGKPSAPPGPSENTLATMAQIALFLSRQQNSHGGFQSTTDTVVGLQALASFARILYTPHSQHTIEITGSNGKIGEFDLNPENRLLVQRQDLPDPTGDYSLQVKGNGWFLTQATVVYYIPVPKENTAFSLAMVATSDKCLNGVAKNFNLSVTLSYQGYRNASSMTVINIRMLSGFHPDYWSLRELENSKVIAKAEENSKGELEIYLDSVSNDPITFSFRVSMGERVIKVKESSALVYDYYEQGENGYASYSHPCSK